MVMSPSKIRLLIADDHAGLRKTWRLLLEQDDRLEVVGECDNGKEAIAAARLFKPDVVLMDINMKPLNGFEATKEISRELPETKIIGMSINNQLAYLRKMFASGAKGYITKNSTKEEMIKAILEVYAGREYVCEEMRG
jgi:two-component system invasion response regulator UvrY